MLSVFFIGYFMITSILVSRYILPEIKNESSKRIVDILIMIITAYYAVKILDYMYQYIEIITFLTKKLYL